jgi:hypothetical protein
VKSEREARLRPLFSLLPFTVHFSRFLASCLARQQRPPAYPARMTAVTTYAATM